jgi:hypothetical protein
MLATLVAVSLLAAPPPPRLTGEPSEPELGIPPVVATASRSSERKRRASEGLGWTGLTLGGLGVLTVIGVGMGFRLAGGLVNQDVLDADYQLQSIEMNGPPDAYVRAYHLRDELERKRDDYYLAARIGWIAGPSATVVGMALALIGMGVSRETWALTITSDGFVGRF